MRQKRYQEVRFYLFANSYSGKAIVTFVREKCKGKKLSDAVKRLSRVLDLNCKQTEKFIFYDLSPDCPYKRMPIRLKVYLEIEKELSALVEEKLDQYSTAFEDYGYKLLSPAFERAAGNSIKDIEDEEFERILNLQIKKCIYIYYRMAYKYKLPTLRIVPFIIRLISS